MSFELLGVSKGRFRMLQRRGHPAAATGGVKFAHVGFVTFPRSVPASFNFFQHRNGTVYSWARLGATGPRTDSRPPDLPPYSV